MCIFSMDAHGTIHFKHNKVCCHEIMLKETFLQVVLKISFLCLGIRG